MSATKANNDEAYSDDEKEKRFIQNKILSEKKYQEWLASKKSNDKRDDQDDERRTNKLKEAEFGWKETKTLGSIPPSDYTITHINQNYDLLVTIILKIN